MTFRHLFVIDPLASLNVKLDSSLRMMAALAARGHEIYVCEPRQLAWRKGAKAAEAVCQALRFQAGAAEKFEAQRDAKMGLETFAAVHMRKDPPYDMDYITTTWLLDAAPKTTRVYNRPEALRSFNEKLAIFGFGEEVRPGIVSADPEALLAFIEKDAKGDGILKPLTLFGGRGVMRVEAKDDATRAAARKLLASETSDGMHLRLVQAFDPAIYDGEVRAFTAFGKAMAWCLKKPEAGNYLANTRAGATLTEHKPSVDEVRRIESVAKALLPHGIVFIGFDVIGGYVSEINITSPRLLVGPGDQRRHYEEIAEMIEKDLA